jgi:hypothetical protein
VPDPTFGTVQLFPDPSNLATYTFTGLTDPGSNNLLVLFLLNSKGSSPPDTPSSVAGWGLTFSAWGGAGDVVSFSSGAASKKLSVWRARGTTTAGDLTVAFGGVTQLACDYIMVPVTANFNTGGTNGSGAAAGSVSISISIGTDEGGIACFGSDATIAGGIDPDASWTEVADQTSTNPGRRQEVQTTINNVSTASATAAAGTPAMGGIAVEILPAAADTGIGWLPLLPTTALRREGMVPSGILR